MLHACFLRIIFFKKITKIGEKLSLLVYYIKVLEERYLKQQRRKDT